MKIYLNNDKPGITAAEVNDRTLADLALRYAGDDGMTVAGTAEAMEFMSRVRNLKPGQTLALPKAPKYYIEVADEN